MTEGIGLIILYSILILVALGLILGFALSFASKALHVEEDKRIEEVAKMLPNYNCGACGYAGCKGMAEAIVSGEETNIKKCKPGKVDKNFAPIKEYLEKTPGPDGKTINLKL